MNKLIALVLPFLTFTESLNVNSTYMNKYLDYCLDKIEGDVK